MDHPLMPPPRKLKRPRESRFSAITVCGFAVFAIWGIGQIFKDAYWSTGLCFYIPTLVICGFLFLFCLYYLLLGSRLAFLFALLLIPPAFSLAFVENRFLPRNAPAPAPQALRLAHWNVLYAKFGVSGVLRQLAAEHADIVVITDVPRGMSLRVVQQHMGAAFQGTIKGGMAVFCRGSVTPGEILTPKGPLTVVRAVCRLNDTELSIFAVNMKSSIWIPRNRYLKELMRLMINHQPDFVVGDMNAPRRSAALNPLPAGYRHAFDLAGSGWGYTWPEPRPLYAIDQCLVNSTIEVLDYRIRATHLSFHRMQVLDFNSIRITGRSAAAQSSVDSPDGASQR
ncbi:MAG: hypothetical protein HY343_09210 [Lentisphaerae bacterium]|nr:hypothetical protein [Lentisphaerota bacterium]